MIRRINHGLCAVAFTLLVACAPVALATAASADRFEVLGVRLGMTQSEVEASAASYDPEVKTTIKLSRFSYFDGWKSKSTDDFTKTMIVAFPAKGGELEVDFSPPPDGGRVVRISRRGGYGGRKTEFPPYENFLQSLIQKYGEPELERRRSAGGELLWARPVDKKVCLNTESSWSLTVNETNYDLSKPDECARLLYYNLEPGTPGGPVQRLTAVAIDVAEIVRTDLAASAWLKKLSDEARATRSPTTPGDAPDL